MSTQYTRDQVSQHSKPDSAWIIIDTKVYDITKFAAAHPGGELLLLSYAGKDCTGRTCLCNPNPNPNPNPSCITLTLTLIGNPNPNPNPNQLSLDILC